jgi:acyl-[acyl-carrier-protein]-phospholipid O-acyltransferase/long-chain-fatty-acid--[acyl-carrier-protein] ligase
MLSHYNIVSNVQQLNQILAFGEDDAFVGILPFFHSFGFTATLGLPALNGVGVGYQANPLDGKGVGAMVEKHRLTFLLATPTFLQIYLRSCRREQLESLRMVVTGAEKLPQRLAEAFEKRFGIRPLEGYGCTECAPGVAANTRSFEVGEEVQLGGKEGTVGQPLPGMAVKVVDPETFEELPLGQAGLLLVKGPNVMPGYLGRPDLTEKALRDGWYVTGDIVAVDADGFLTITDRLSRFSKIGGEMVPHIGVEEALHALAGVTEPTFAVTGLPDERKGERLVVVHTLDEEALAPVLKKLAESDLPNLWRPKPNQFHRVEVLPYLGSGKLDLRGVKALAEGARPT